MAAGLERDAEARVCATTTRPGSFNQDAGLQRPRRLPDDGTPTWSSRSSTLDSRGDKNNFGPRVGLAWDVNDGRSVVRAGYGIYYNPMNIQISRPGGQQPAAGRRRRSPTRRIRIRTAARTRSAFVSTAPQNIAILANDLENLQSRPTPWASRRSSGRRWRSTWTASTTR